MVIAGCLRAGHCSRCCGCGSKQNKVLALVKLYISGRKQTNEETNKNVMSRWVDHLPRKLPGARVGYLRFSSKMLPEVF